MKPFPRRRIVPLAGGVVALIVAGIAEAIVESGNPTPITMYLYFFAIACFTVSAWPLPLQPSDLPATRVYPPPPVATRRRARLILVAGVVAGIGAHILAVKLLLDDIRSLAGDWLWFTSLLLPLLAAIISSKGFGWRPRWGTGVWPTSLAGRRWLLVAVILILVVGAAARLLGLGDFPHGVTYDEGDRSSVAVQIMLGFNRNSIFETGWYHIPNLYFWLLSGLFHAFGIGIVQARLSNAIPGLISLALVMWIGLRHFGWRVGVMAGTIMALLGIALQFARQTSESGPTATLWCISAAMFLEAARTGKLWAWVGAGMSGAFALYFYPSGRLWAVLAGLYCLYLFVHGLGKHRVAILGGIALAAIVAVMVVTPFFIHAREDPDIVSARGAETSIFTKDNVTRLGYYQPGWSTFRLLQEQLVRSVGIFNQFEGGGYWPVGKPLMYGSLSVLTLLGLGWVGLRWRDPRYVLLALWFWTGFIGVVVTVETPAVQRMATAVPTIALLGALTLDSLIRRVEFGAAGWRAAWGRPARLVATAAALMLVTVLAVQQGQFYFVTSNAPNQWPRPIAEGRALSEQPRGALLVTIGRQYFLINAGWVRWLAPDKQHGGVASPDTNLPLPRLADRDLTFMTFAPRFNYLPYIQDLYPGGGAKSYYHPTEGHMFDLYTLPQATWAASQGAIATPPNGVKQPVDSFGLTPPGWHTYPSPMRWSAGLYAPRYWNYALRIGPGPATLNIDGQTVLTVPLGSAIMTATLSLARGYHYVAYDGTLTSPGHDATFQWSVAPPFPAAWHTPRREELSALQTAPRGLYGVVDFANRPQQRLIANSLLINSLSNQLGSFENYTATFTGKLLAPRDGDYQMEIYAQGGIDLQIDGKPVIQSPQTNDAMKGVATLTYGPHTVRCVMHVEGDGGRLEWSWTTPDGAYSIIPPSALVPDPLGVGVGPSQDVAVYGDPTDQPAEEPMESIP